MPMTKKYWHQFLEDLGIQNLKECWKVLDFGISKSDQIWDFFFEWLFGWADNFSTLTQDQLKCTNSCASYFLLLLPK